MSRRSARLTSGLRLAGQGSRSAARKRSHHRGLFFEPLEARRLLALLTVGNDTDLVNADVSSIAALMANPGADGVSLREAIAATNATAGTDEIQFNPAILNGGTAKIFLTAGELVISDSLTVRGLGANRLTIDASGSDDPTPGVNNNDGHRALRVEGSVGPINVTLEGLSITGGEATFADDLGAGILNSENLTLRAVSIFGNRGQLGGDSGRGGGIANMGNLTVDSCAIIGNDAAVGGGILNQGTMSIVNSTISSNRAGFVGGGIAHGSSQSLIRFSTITLNQVDSQGGGAGINSSAGLHVATSIVSGNVNNDDVAGTFDFPGSFTEFNLIGNGSAAESFNTKRSTTPGLLPLDLNGGSTLSHALTDSSPAIDGVYASFVEMPTTDQRGAGNLRSRGYRPDFGAIESSFFGMPDDPGPIDNDPPVVTVPGPVTIFEGETLELQDVTFSDDFGPLTASINWGDGSSTNPADIDEFAGVFNDEHTYADNGQYQVQLTVSDGEFATTASFTVIVSNRRPTLAPIANRTILAGQELSIPMLGEISDPGFDNPQNPSGTSSESFRYYIDWGDGQTFTGDNVDRTNGGAGVPTKGTFSGAHTFVTADTYQVKVRVADDDMSGNFASGVVDIDFVERTFQVTVSPTEAPSLVVTTALDVVANDGVTSLREAIARANSTLGADTITFADGLFGQSILVGQGEFVVTEALAIDATTLADNVTIDAQLQSRIFNITATTGDFTLAGLTLTRGRTTDSNAFFGNTHSGGAIRSVTNGNLFLVRSTVSASETAGDGARGGGVYALGDVTLTDCLVSGNSTTGEAVKFPNDTAYWPNGGGGIHTRGAATLTKSVVSGNSTAGIFADGGGISANSVVLTQSTISGNSTIGKFASGGGINALGVTLTQSTINGNSTAGELAGGGGIFGYDVTLTQTTLSGNSTAGRTSKGGGINALRVTLTRSTVNGNSTAGDGAEGGGIVATTDVTLVQSTLSDNSTTGEFATGGGIHASGVTLIQSSVIRNSTGGERAEGGGIYIFGPQPGSVAGVTLTQSTVSGNRTAGNLAHGGGIYVRNISASETTVTVSHSTITDNHALEAAGGGVYLYPQNGLLLLVSNSIVAGNTASIGGADLSAENNSTISANHSLFGVADNVTITDDLGNLKGTANNPLDPLLAPLGDNSGPTLTHALLPGSPAIHAGDPSAVAGQNGVPEFDQRGDGFSRVRFGRIDMGAVESEFEGPSLVVTTAQDVVANDGLTSLREAIAYANSTVEADTITFAAGLSGRRIELKLGELKIEHSLSIDASALASPLTIDARGNDATPSVADGMGSRIFNIASSNYMLQIDVTIEGVTLTGGDVNSIGGAIYNQESLTLRRVLLFGNSAVRQGGGIANYGSLTIQQSTLSGNTAGAASGGGGPVAGFVSTPRGGAVYSNYGSVTISDSTISNNAAEFGGGIFGLYSDVQIIASTIGQNSATNRGGGLWIENGNQSPTRIFDIRHSTIYRNSANLTGSGLLLLGPLDATISHTIIAGTGPIGRPADVSFGTTSPNFEYSLISSTGGLTDAELAALNSGPGNILNEAPLLGALADNGGTTLTYSLLPGSPAASAGLSGAIGGENGIPLWDQRGTGFSRVRGLSVDIGALEAQNDSPSINVPLTSATANEGNEFDISTTVFFLDPNATDQHTVVVNWGDGTVDNNVPIGGVSGPRFVLGKHTYRDNGPFVVTVTVDDGFNTTNREFMVNVANVDPTGSFGNNGSVDEGSSATVSFSSSFDAGEADRLAGLRYAYDFDNDGTFEVGDGSYVGSVSATSQVVPAAFLADGPSSRTVRAWVIDKNGGRTEYTTVIDVLNADPVADAGGPYEVDERQKIRLNGTAFDVPGDTLTFAWDFDNDEVFDDATGATPDFDATNVDGPATIIVRLRVTDGEGGVDFDTATINVRIAPPVVDAGGPYFVDERSSVVLAASAIDVDGDSLVYEWDFDNDGLYENDAGASPLFSAANLNGPTSVTVRLRVSDGDGGVGFDTADIVVRNAPPEPDAGGPYNVDEGGRVTLQASAIDAVGDTLTYEWDLDGDGLYDATGTNPEFHATNINGPATIIVRLRVTDGDGDEDFDTATINVRNVPPRVDAGGDYAVDEGGSVRLGAIAVDVTGDTLLYEWDFNGDGLYDDDTGASPVFSAANLDGPTTLTVGVRVTDSDGAASVATATIKVLDVPPRPIPRGPYMVNEGSRVQLQATGDDVPGDPLTYAWDFDNNGTYEVTGANPTFSAAGLDGPATVTVGLRVTDDDGVSAVTTTTIEIRNVAPRIRSLSPGRVDATGLTVLNGVIEDPGTNDTLSLLIMWGDGTEEPLILPPGETTFTATHQYLTDGGSFLTPGVWPITVMVTDAVDQVEGSGEADDPSEPIIPFNPPPIIPEVENSDVPFEPFDPPATAPEPPEQIQAGFGFPISDGGAGGKYLDGNDEGYKAPNDALEAERALQALLSSPRAVRRDEIVDAVHELGELELVSLLGFDLGDEPVFVAQKPVPKPQPTVAAPVAEPVAQPLAITTEKPVLPDDSGGNALFWTALGVSGSLWVGGAWWWRRRQRRLLQERASLASRETISDF